ncbi:hypothetical protein [Bradyrhizobium viridifuturi]|uniref:hypothetical protein n=1 Tax=Bradyrhizobium viridifuturi TaxID=1654716 RepID=UPI000A527759|nr:hypothetical protein [Bradyrhizobium viridifuturi]
MISRKEALKKAKKALDEWCEGNISMTDVLDTLAELQRTISLPRRPSKQKTNAITPA